MVGSNSHIGYRNIDLTGITQIEFMLQAQPRSASAGGYVEIHLDSPDGKLLGQTEQVYPKDVNFRAAVAKINAENAAKNKSKNPPPPVDMNAVRKMVFTTVTAPLDPVRGVHDIYFVFKNPDAKANQILVQAMEIEFQNKAVEK
jgi:cytochrome c